MRLNVSPNRIASVAEGRRSGPFAANWSHTVVSVGAFAIVRTGVGATLLSVEQQQIYQIAREQAADLRALRIRQSYLWN
jgi:hypothetical protein